MIKKIISILLITAMIISVQVLPAKAAFKDITDEVLSFKASVLQSLGVVSGYEDGTFRPTAKLTRAEFSKLAVAVMGLSKTATNYASKTLFNDVKGGTWAAGYVNLAYTQGIINGYGNGSFGINDSITYGQAVTIILRILGYTEEQTGSIWPDNQISYAASLNLDEGLTLKASDTLTRGAAVTLLYNFLYTKTKSAKLYYTTIQTSSSVSNAVITSYVSGKVTYRDSTGEKTISADYSLSDSLLGLCGTLLLSESGSSKGFIPEENNYKDIVIAGINSASITDTDGKAYSISTDVKLYGSKTTYTFGTSWFELLVGSSVRLYYDEAGVVESLYSSSFDEAQVKSRLTDVIIVSASEGTLNYLSGGELISTELSSTSSGSNWVGSKGTLLIAEDGLIIGFIPDNNTHIDLSLKEVKASGITDTTGIYHKVSSGTQLYINGELVKYSSGWTLLNGDSSLRLYYDDAGAISLVYVHGNSYDDYAAAAETKTVLQELTRKLGIKSTDYTIIKNGYKAESEDLAQYDVGQYDAVTGTLLVTDKKISGCIEDMVYSAGELTSVTMLGNTFRVLDCALDTLKTFTEGDRVTLLLTEDNRVAAAYNLQTVTAAMKGILTLNGTQATVKLINGVTVSGTPDSSSLSALDGTLVSVSAISTGKLSITALSSDVEELLNLSTGKLGSSELAPNIKVFDWAGSGAVVEIKLEDVSWTRYIAANKIEYAGYNSVGQVEVLLLKDITGDAYEYGIATVTNNTSTGTTSVSVENSGGSSKSGTTAFSVTSGSYIGIALKGNGALAGYKELTMVKNIAINNFIGQEFVKVGDYELPISENVQVYDKNTNLWMSLEEALTRYQSFTVYYDRNPENGGKIRIITVE